MMEKEKEKEKSNPRIACWREGGVTKRICRLKKVKQATLKSLEYSGIIMYKNDGYNKLQ